MNSLVVVLVSLLLLPFATSSSSSAPTPIFPNGARPTISGYLPVNSTSSSALYFAFYEAKTRNSSISDTPLLIWLQGGPGCSSMLGNFIELGPWLVSSGGANPPFLTPNKFSWNRLFGLLFLDNPIGTGFSIAASVDEIPRDEPTVARHLYYALRSFFSSNPSFRSRPLYVTGESYAGKYVPFIGAYILQQNSKLKQAERMNLKGIAVGNGLTHPVKQVGAHAAAAYYAGLINSRQRRQLEQLQRVAKNLTLLKRWSDATAARGRLLDSLLNATGLATLQDTRRTTPYDAGPAAEFLSHKEAKIALGAKPEVEWAPCSDAVGEAMDEDVMKSAKKEVEDVLKRGKVKVLLYQGQFDLQDGVAGNEAWVEEMVVWQGSENFLAAERVVWVVEEEVAGYVQRWEELSHVVVSRAGHLVPADQGRNSLAMVEDWVLEQGLFGRRST